MDRRHFLRGGSLAAIAPLASCGGLLRHDADPLAHHDATALTEAVRRGDATPAELLTAALARIDRLNPRLNAIVTRWDERSRAEANGALPEGPFRGVPYALKDLVDLQGTRRTAGSRLLAAHVSGQSSEIVARTLQAGVVVLGKTNTPEFALNASTEPVLFGPSRNPWDTTRSPGGSSGGAAVAVASGMLPFAHASDGGGSIRIPASCCGLFGLKPSHGRMVGSRASDSGVEHALTRSVRDSATLFAWNQRRDAQAPLPPIDTPPSAPSRRLTIGLSTRGLHGHAPAASVTAAIEDTARLCTSLGHRVVPIDLPVDGEAFYQHFMTAWSGGAARVWQMAVDAKHDPEQLLEPWTLHLAAHARRAPADARPRAAAYFAELSRRFDDFFSRIDVMLTPVVSDEPPPLGHLGLDVPGPLMWDRLLAYAAYTAMHNAAGTPAMSVPLGWSASGLPIGSQFSARVGREALLFSLAFELEAARPWAQRWPTLAS